MGEGLVKQWNRSRVRIIIPLIHFLLSFVYERSILIFSLDKNVVTAIPMNNIISARMERMFGYACAKMFALILIYAFWYIIFSVYDYRHQASTWVFVSLALLISISTILVYPFLMDSTWDFFVTYSYAIRFWPEYWHSAYSSLIYAGMLMVFPTPVMMPPLQTVLTMGAIGYLYKRIKDSKVLKGHGKWLVCLFFIIPLSYNLFTNQYRTNQYAVLCLFFYGVVLMDVIDKRYRNWFDRLVIILMAAFVSVWRTEGIIAGALTILIAICFVYGEDLVNKLVLFVSFLVLTLIIMVPQKLGDAKYYGKDYQFINSFPALYNILNDTSHNLEYDGVQEDLAAINAVVPVDLVTLRGMDGYRRYNYYFGSQDINQSMADRKQQKAYLKAYYSLIRHNIPIFAKTQISAMAASMGLMDTTYKAPFIGIDVIDYPEWHFVGWDNGREDVFTRPATAYWSKNIIRQYCLLGYMNLTNWVGGITKAIYYRGIYNVTVLMFLTYIAIQGVISLFTRNKDKIFFGLISIVILGQMAAIMLVMPENNIAYIHPSLCLANVLFTAYISRMLVNRER